MSDTFINEDHPAVDGLRRRMDAFYAGVETYSDFKRQNPKDRFWNPIRRHLEQRVEAVGRVRVLEFGAGRSVFGEFLGPLRDKVEYHCQDVTDQNLDHLESQADRVWIRDLREIHESYDVVFSSFAWEHLCQPRQTLEHMLERLAPGGSVFLIAPRYDFPGYLSPSCRHYGVPKRMALSVWLMGVRLSTRLTGRPRFLLHADPAVFHLDWKRDYDAVHWASWHDLPPLRKRGYTVRRVAIEPSGLKHRFFVRFLLLYAQIIKPGGDVTPDAG